MRVTKLNITNFRNIESAQLEPHPRLNFILGPNGAGKTSILETLVLLAKGRSFRSGTHRDLIGPYAKKVQVHCQLVKNGQRHKLGIERSISRWRGRLDGEEMKQRAGLAHLLPHILIEPNSHLLVDGGPDFRRRYLDWSVFHVKQAFLSTWVRFHRSLKQRNALLKQPVNDQHDITLRGLDQQLAECGTEINQFRQGVFTELAGLIESATRQISHQLPRFELSYTKGWSGDAYLDYLEINRQRDIDAGQTLGGPHRANIDIQIGKDRAKDRFSRGQQKAFSTAMLWAQVEHLKTHSISPLVLLDDPASEFDEDTLNKLIQQVINSPYQTWVTSISHDLPGWLKVLEAQPKDYAVFHVKHGKVEKML